MSTSAQLTGLKLERVLAPSPDDLEEILQVMIKGFKTESFATKFPPPHSTLAVMTREDFDRAQYMCWLGPALIEGQVWIVRTTPGGAIVGVGIWSLPGHAGLRETPEQRKFGEAFSKLVSPEEIAFDALVKRDIVSERNVRFPNLWRDTYHLHNLVTIPEGRGKGVGGALIGEMIRQAREKGAGMSLCTPTEANRRFYEGQGFKTVWEAETTYADGEKSAYIVMTHE